MNLFSFAKYLNFYANHECFLDLSVYLNTSNFSFHWFLLVLNVLAHTFVMLNSLKSPMYKHAAEKIVSSLLFKEKKFVKILNSELIL